MMKLKKNKYYEIHHVKRIWSRPFFVKIKKQYCPTCGKKIKIQTVPKIVNSKSDEAKNYDFSSVDSFMIGIFKFIWKEFVYLECNTRYSVNEIYQAEKVKKNTR